MVAPIYGGFMPPRNPVQYPSRNAATVVVSHFTPEMDFPWVKDKNIQAAIRELSQITFDSYDVAYVKSMGVKLPFNSGAEALNFLKQSNARILFAPLSSPEIHAQYDFDQNFVKINSLYKDTLNTAEILAIAEAILHESGHAKDGDSLSSLQEEVNCLAMNALAHRYLQKRYPHMFANSNALIVKDGVSVYERLFFDADPQKTGLVSRLQDKYGYLPAGDDLHPPSELALRAKGGIPAK